MIIWWFKNKVTRQEITLFSYNRWYDKVLKENGYNPDEWEYIDSEIDR